MDFTLSFADVVNMIFIAAGFGICCMSVLQVGSGIHIRKEVKGYFQPFFTLINVFICMHLFRMLFEGHTSAEFYLGIRAVTFIEFLASGFMIYMLSLLILFIANPPGKMGRVINCIFLIILCIHRINN